MKSKLIIILTIFSFPLTLFSQNKKIKPKNNIKEQKLESQCSRKTNVQYISNLSNYISSDNCVRFMGRVLNTKTSPEAKFIDVYPPKSHLSQKESITIVIFPDEYHEIRDIERFEGETVNIYGSVTEYRGEPQIILKSSKQISLSPFH